ncbi:unnamed protein product, partial [marine sediment metagenome]
TWLCSRIDSTSRDMGLSWGVTYEFIYNRETWDPWVYYVDKTTGQPPTGLTEGGTHPGKAKFRVYKMANFGALGLVGA